MDADERFARRNRIEQFFLLLGGDRIAGSVKGDSIELIQVAVEHGGILAANHFEAGIFAPLGEQFFRPAKFAVRFFSINFRMHEARAFGEVQDFLFLFVGGRHPAQWKGRKSDYGCSGGQQHFTAIHGEISRNLRESTDCISE